MSCRFHSYSLSTWSARPYRFMAILYRLSPDLTRYSDRASTAAGWAVAASRMGVGVECADATCASEPPAELSTPAFTEAGSGRLTVIPGRIRLGSRLGFARA